jgi:hypothetical protein
MTSSKTNKEILSIIEKHLTKEKAINLFTELSTVDGNKSFKDSIKNLLKLLKS